MLDDVIKNLLAEVSDLPEIPQKISRLSPKLDVLALTFLYSLVPKTKTCIFLH